MTTAYHSRDKRCSAYSRPKNKKLVEQQLRDYLEKTYGEFCVADEVTFGLKKETWWDKNRRERWEKQKETNS